MYKNKTIAIMKNMWYNKPQAERNHILHHESPAHRAVKDHKSSRFLYEYFQFAKIEFNSKTIFVCMYVNS